jgi:putative transport protein
VIAGIQTQPAVLAFAGERMSDEHEVSLGYASVYPLAVIAKIVVAQVMLRVLLG